MNKAEHKADAALSFSNPRILAALYYGLLSVVGTILINAFLTSIGIKEVVPVFQSILLGMVVASITGALFGERIIYCPRPYLLKTFLLGFIMVIISLPFFDLGLVLFMQELENPLFKITNFSDFIYAFFMTLGYSYVLFGIVLAIAAGVASMYLRSHFVYYVLSTDKRRSRRLPRYIAAKDNVKAKPRTKTKTMQDKET